MRGTCQTKGDSIGRALLERGMRRQKSAELILLINAAPVLLNPAWDLSAALELGAASPRSACTSGSAAGGSSRPSRD